MKREGISTLFIHGYPWALSYLVFRSLALIFDCLKNGVCVCVCVFWKCFEIDAFVSATIVMTRVWVYTTVCIFSKRYFKVFLEVCFESVCEVWFLKRRQVFCFASLIQVTKSSSTPKFLKRLLLCFNPFNKFVPPLYLVDNLMLGCERDRRGSSFGP